MKTNVCIKGFKKDKNGNCRKVTLPKKGTVCLEGYKISKNGKCVKDKKYAIIASSSETKNTPLLPNVCLEGYKFSDKDGKCKKNTLGLSTVCKEGYKVTKNGRCIKDKNYTTVFSTTKIVDIPAPDVKTAIENSSPSKLLKATTPEEVKDILKQSSNINVPTKIAKEIADAKSPSKIMSIFSPENVSTGLSLASSAFDFVNSNKDLIPDLVKADTPKKVDNVLVKKELYATPEIKIKIAKAQTPVEVKQIFKGGYISTISEILKSIIYRMFGIKNTISDEKLTIPSPKLVSQLVDAKTPNQVNKVLDSAKPPLFPRPSLQTNAKIAESSSPDNIKKLIEKDQKDLPPSYSEIMGNLADSSNNKDISKVLKFLPIAPDQIEKVKQISSNIVNASTVDKVENVLNKNNLMDSIRNGVKLASTEAPKYGEIVADLAKASNNKDISKIFNSIPVAPPPPGNTTQKLVEASTVDKVENVLNKNNLMDAIKAGVKLRTTIAEEKPKFSSPFEQIKAGGFSLKNSSDRVLNTEEIKDNSKVKEKPFQFGKNLFDEIKAKGQEKMKKELANTETKQEVKEILKDNDIKKTESVIEDIVKADTPKKVEDILDNSKLVASVGPAIPITSELTQVISKSNPEDLKLIESENYIKKVLKEHGVEYTGCSSLNEVLKKFRTKCIKAIGYSTDLPQDKCIQRHLSLIDIRYPSFKKHLGIIGCIIDDKLVKSFA